jgi:hypothetical protein
MALQTTAVARQMLSSNHVGTAIDTNGTIALQQRNGVFCAVRAEMLYSGQCDSGSSATTGNSENRSVSTGS